MKYALIVNQLMTRTADVINDLVVPPFEQRLADPSGKIVERVVPGYALPFAVAAFAHTAHRIADPLSVVDLIQSRWTLGAVAAAAPGMKRIALELADARG